MLVEGSFRPRVEGTPTIQKCVGAFPNDCILRASLPSRFAVRGTNVCRSVCIEVNETKGSAFVFRFLFLLLARRAVYFVAGGTPTQSRSKKGPGFCSMMVVVVMVIVRAMMVML